jgi:hypothetical protein
MKQALLLTLALFCTCSLSAQKNDYRNVQPFEGEAGIGMIINAQRDLHKSPGYSLYVEGRFNARRTGWDLGAQLFAGHYVEEFAFIDSHKPTDIEHIKPLVFSVYGDYNFRHDKNVSIFVGAGPAVTYMMCSKSFGNTYLTLSSRAGVEFRHRYRLTVDYRIIGSDYQIFGINLGYTLGGRPK